MRELNYGDRIKLIRTGKDISQEEIGKALGISKQQFGKYENGVHQMPLHYLVKTCEYLQVSADYILGLPKTMPYPPFE